MSMNSISRYLLERVEAEGLDIIQISKETGIGYRSVLRIINGEGSPNVSTLEPILDYFGVELALVKRKKVK